MEVLIASEDNDGLMVRSIGRHQQAVSVDLLSEPCPIDVKGDAKSVTADGVVTALVDPESTTDDGFWFFEVTKSFTRARVLARGTCLLLSLAHVSVEADAQVASMKMDLPTNARPTAIVLFSEFADLYLITNNTPLFSESDWITWTDYTIPLDTSAAWRVAGSRETVDGLERLPINSTDRLANTAQLQEALGSLQSLRIRGGQPARAHLVLLRSLTAIRPVDPSE